MNYTQPKSFAAALDTIHMERANAGLDRRPVHEMSGYWFDRYFQIIEEIEREEEDERSIGTSRISK